MKSVLILQTKNNYFKLALSLHKHHKIFDLIIILDHQSSLDLRSINMFHNVKIFRINIISYSLDAYVNFIYQRLNLCNSFDFIFRLDDDEYLNFSNKKKFQKFLQQNTNKKLIKLYWKNGIFLNSFKDINQNNINKVLDTFKISPNSSHIYKLAYNKSLKKIFIKHGSHNFFPSYKNKIFNLDLFTNKLEIFHIPYLNVNDISIKINHFPKKYLKDKIITFDPYKLYDGKSLDNIRIFQIVHNYRNLKNEHISVLNFKNSKFFQNPDEVMHIYKHIRSLPKINTLEKVTKKEHNFFKEFEKIKKDNKFYLKFRTKKLFSILNKKLTITDSNIINFV